MIAVRRQAPRRVWLRMFGVGLALWVACAAVTYLPGNPHLIPTLVLLGSFLVPMAFVSWAFERRDSGELTAELLFRTFVVRQHFGVQARLEAFNAFNFVNFGNPRSNIGVANPGRIETAGDPRILQLGVRMTF